MSFDRETDSILTGSLNLLAASALIPQSDALALKNWRVDQSGALRSRLDMLLLAAYAGNVHTLHTRWGSPPVRYAGWDNNVSRDGSLLHSGFDGSRVGMADMNGYTWIMNRAAQGRDNGSGWASWGPTAPALAPTVAGAAGGVLAIGVTYTYWVTFVDNHGQESNPSPSVTYVPTNPNQNAQLTRPATVDPTITGWNVYRGGNTLPAPYLINPTPFLLAQTTFIDDGGAGFNQDGSFWNQYSDEGLVNLGVQMQTDSDPPPACRGLAGPYFDRLLAWDSAAHPNWLYWSRQLEPSFFPGSALSEGNHVPVGKDGEELVTVTLHAVHARIYKQSSIWRLSGDPGDTNSTLEPTNEEIGLIGDGAIASYADLDYFQGAEGIYVSNGYTARKISGKLDPLFKGDDLKLANVPLPPALNQNLTVRAGNRLEIVNGRLYFSYASPQSSAPDHTLVYDIQGDRWYDDDRGFLALLYEGQGLNFLGSLGGSVYVLEQPQTTPIDVTFQTAYRDQGERDKQKTYADVVVEYSVASGVPAPLVVSAWFDDGDIDGPIGIMQVAQFTPPGSGRQRDVYQLNSVNGDEGMLARNISIRVAGTINQPLIIYSLAVHYFLHPRDAMTFDSGAIDLGHPGTKRCDLIQLDLDTNGYQIDWQLFTDQPSDVLNPGQMALRANGSIAIFSGRKCPEIPLPTGPEGRLIRLVLKAAPGLSQKPFRVYGCRVRNWPLGLYLDVGESYTTLEISA